jgi:hypothetical protein
VALLLAALCVPLFSRATCFQLAEDLEIVSSLEKTLLLAHGDSCYLELEAVAEERDAARRKLLDVRKKADSDLLAVQTELVSYKDELARVNRELAEKAAQLAERKPLEEPSSGRGSVVTKGESKDDSQSVDAEFNEADKDHDGPLPLGYFLLLVAFVSATGWACLRQVRFRDRSGESGRATSEKCCKSSTRSARL